MPLYAYQCAECGDATEAFNRMSERVTSAPVCGKNATHGQMDVKIQPVIGYVQRDCHYRCPVTRKMVTSNRQRTNIMREHNLIDANDFPPSKQFFEKSEQAVKDRAALGKKLKDPLLFHD